MKAGETDIVIIGAGPVGLACAYLSGLCGLNSIILDKSDAPLQVGRADALNARTLQLFELAGLFEDLYPIGKPCSTSSVWANGKFLSRQSSWWDELEGCFHKHFLMIGQCHIEKLLDQKLRENGNPVRRNANVKDVKLEGNHCLTQLATGEEIASKYVIGADGPRSLVREGFEIPFVIERPQIIWAVIDAVIETDFPKVPEIIVFQGETSDVAWIPREGEIDRFYVRMDTKEFTLEDALAKIDRAMRPHSLRLKRLDWFSSFSVKEAVAKNYSVANKVFLAGDACHVHSVNGGQGLNTGLADAFNLIWKIHMVETFGANQDLLSTYETERQPVALGVVETSGQLVRATKFSETKSHAEDYVKIVEKKSGYITGMGIRYPGDSLIGTRLHDIEVYQDGVNRRLYSLLDYRRYTRIVFGSSLSDAPAAAHENVLVIGDSSSFGSLWTKDGTYQGRIVYVRPDGYIAGAV